MRVAIAQIAFRFCQASSKIVTLRSDEANKLSTIVMSNPKKRNTLSLQAINLIKDNLQQVEKDIVAKKTKVSLHKFSSSSFKGKALFFVQDMTLRS